MSPRDRRAVVSAGVQLVVTIDSDGREIIIGGGRYVAFDLNGSRGAEIAFIVEEDYHGLGVAGSLLRHLTRIAREKGVSRFDAEVLTTNRAMLSVFRRSRLPMTETQAEDVIHVTLFLADKT